MTPNALLPTVADRHDEQIPPTVEDRPLSLGAAFVGFILSTALTSTVIVLLSQ